MSGAYEKGYCCDQQTVFELSDGALSPSRKREVEDHMATCDGCRALYEREVRISSGLASFDGHSLKSSVCREVAISLPTRTAKARVALAALAIAILAAAGLALSFDGSNPVAMAAGTLDSLWSVGSLVADVAAIGLVLAAPVIIIALAVGAVLDLAIAGVVYSAMRRRVGQSKRA